MPAKKKTSKPSPKRLMLSAEVNLEDAIGELYDACKAMGFDYASLWPHSDLDGRLEEARMFAAQARNKLVEVVRELEKE